jgi:hypothetical protein
VGKLEGAETVPVSRGAGPRCPVLLSPAENENEQCSLAGREGGQPGSSPRQEQLMALAFGEYRDSLDPPWTG